MRRGLFEIITAFFLVAVLVFAIIFFLYMNTSSSLLYSKVQEDVEGPREAVSVKDALLACHRLEYLYEGSFDEPCPAAQRAFRVTQYEMNGCAAKSWGEPGEFSQTVPFVVSVEQASGLRCLARLEVFLP